MQSLDTLESMKYRSDAEVCGLKMPKGVSVPSGLKSWSTPVVPVRLWPPRLNGPIRTVVLDDVLDVVEQPRQVEFGGLAAAAGEGVQAGDAATVLLERFAEGVASPAKQTLGLA